MSGYREFRNKIGPNVGIGFSGSYNFLHWKIYLLKFFTGSFTFIHPSRGLMYVFLPTDSTHLFY